MPDRITPTLMVGGFDSPQGEPHVLRTLGSRGIFRAEYDELCNLPTSRKHKRSVVAVPVILTSVACSKFRRKLRKNKIGSGVARNHKREPREPAAMAVSSDTTAPANRIRRKMGGRGCIHDGKNG